MGRSWIWAIGRAQLVTVSAALGLVLAGLALYGSSQTNAPTFRDAAYGVSHKHHVKLKGTVVDRITVSVGTSKRNATVVSVSRGSKKVGKLTVDDPSCGGQNCSAGGTANLKVGKIKGKAKLGLLWKSGGSGCGLAMPTCKKAKYGTGTITKGSSSEALRLNTPTTNEPKGSHFTIVLG